MFDSFLDCVEQISSDISVKIRNSGSFAVECSTNWAIEKFFARRS